MHRRDALKFCATLLGTALSPALQRAFASDIALPAATHTSSLTQAQQTLIATLAELIIPTTDTPGAIAAGVPEFISHIYTHWFDASERNIFRQGLERLEGASQAQQQCQFVESNQAFQIAQLANEEQIALQYVSDAPVKGISSREHDPKTPFFSRLKELVVVGYYTSEVGCKQEQIYTPMPGQYQGNLPYADFNRRFTS
jgi:gluconate 2-dehydrogenase gamma chain